jgi:hypothetical protein
VSVYVDASVLVALFTDDALAIRADGFLRTRSPVVIVSDFAAAEFFAHSPSKWEASENTHRGFFCITPVGGLGVGATLHEM